MKPSPSHFRQRGFTLMETVIAIGVVSVLLTGFLIVFTPAAEGIKKSISMQEADRLVAALEQELVSSRTGETPSDADAPTGFQKALSRIKDSTDTIANNLDEADSAKIENALLVYQYRGNPAILRPDGSPEPVVSLTAPKADPPKVGEDYTLVPMLRRKNSALFKDDQKAIEGSIYLVKCVQMVHVPDGTQFALKPLPAPNPTGPKQRGKIYDPAPNSADDEITNLAEYPDAVIAFAAEFYPCPTKAVGFFDGTGFTDFYKRSVKPVFTRNLAIRR